jgi:hypothetical protein
MNARHTLLQDLRAALEKTAARVTALLDSKAPVAVPATVASQARARHSARPEVLARRFAFVTALAAMTATAHEAGARSRPVSFTPAELWADGNVVDVQLQVDGDAAPLYVSPNGDSRHYFEAFAGRNYSVVLRNNSGRRIGVLLTVDGLNVVNGEVTRLASDEPMYVLGPWESATIRGWRSSMDEVRRFVFVDEKRSYASRTGQANSDMGWIRVLAFREQQAVAWRWNGVRSPESDARDHAPLPDEGLERSKREPVASAPEAGSKQAPAPTVQRMDGSSEKEMVSGDTQKDGSSSFPGTGWGDRRTDRVHYVDFTPERRAADQLVFRYEYARGLVALGIYPDRGRLRERDGGGSVGFASAPRW